MPATPYATLADVAAVTGPIDAADQNGITLYLTAASEAIDRETGRRFDTVVETRSFDADDAHSVALGDVVSVTAVAVANSWGAVTTYTTLGAGEYEITPLRASSRSRPYTALRLTGTGWTYLPIGPRTVRVTGTWGWPAVPSDIRMLTVSLAVRLWKAAAAGVAQVVEAPGLGTLRFADGFTADERAVLARYRRPVLV